MNFLGSNALQGKIKQEAIVIDPIGAILISVYIIISWILQANSKYCFGFYTYSYSTEFFKYFSSIGQVRLLTGLSAEPFFLQRLTHFLYNFRPDIITKIDSIQAVHLGTNLLVEVDIGVPGSMLLAEAHDIGAELQKQLETIDDIERAFVHLDFEFEHMPACEHKVI
jgi:divalent metal cation (Fe/Co/Zn/Cd) transporter